jgi:hypothetical protein
VSAQLILRLQRYRDMAQVPRAVQSVAEQIAEEATRLTTPEAVVWRGPVTSVDAEGAVTLGGAHRFHSRALARLLASSTEAYVVVLTVGAAIEERARSMLEAQCFLEGFLMDTAAWAAIVVLARDLRRWLLAEERPAARRVTHRLAPGFLDWPVAEQATLLGVFGEAPLPVRVTEFAWLLPVKSISGVLGVVQAG